MNIVLIAIDALRVDRVGCYGCARPTTPFIDSLAASGVVFENHFTPVVPTQPAFTTIFSGTHPLTHRVFSHAGLQQPNPRVAWLPLLLRAKNFTTVAVDTLYDHRPYFARGFEYYINPRRKGEFPAYDVFNERAIAWLRGCRREPFFMTLHYWDPHTPYLAPHATVSRFYEGDPTTTNVGSLDSFYGRPQIERWPSTWFAHLRQRWPGCSGERIEDAEFIRAHYDAEVATADDGVRQLTEVLDELGLLEDTLLVVFSDHGEELGEHGIWFDHHGLYDTNLRAPLVLHWPRGLGGSRRVSAMSQHQDLAATLLDAVDLKVPRQIEGRTLLPAARGETTTTHWSHSLMACECTWQKKWAMRTPEYKLIVSREPDWHDRPAVELYDLVEDPGEQTDIFSSSPLIARKLLDRFDAQLSSMIESRGLTGDPLAASALTLGRRMWARLGRAYPPAPGDGWKPHDTPRIKVQRRGAPSQRGVPRPVPVPGKPPRADDRGK